MIHINFKNAQEKRKKPVEIEKDGEFKLFPSCVEAAPFLNTCGSTISRYAREKRIYNGHTIKFISKDEFAERKDQLQTLEKPTRS